MSNLIKFYPPNIEGTIPAFYDNVLKVPFSMNKTVLKNQVATIEMKISTINGIYIDSVTAKEVVYDPYYYAIFEFSDNVARRFRVGQFYKIQIAYRSKANVIGYYSNVAIVKHTSEPVISISGLEAGLINMHQYEYIGSYIQTEDTSEKVYSYCFNLYDNNMKLIQTSGELIHNSSLDSSLYESNDAYSINQDLKTNLSYYLEYQVQTINGLKLSSYPYRIMQRKSIDPEIKADLVPVLNFENGYIDLKLIGRKNEEDVEYAATGSFKILRASDEDNYNTWNEILKFALYGQQPSRWMWKDFTVKQGVTYKYALQQYSNVLNSNRIESEPIYVDFEHMFLYDGERQLKIKYNPKVASFKNDILESKMDTIGGQHPFIFRNGNVKYKEFSISGLISCQQDEELLFLDDEKIKKFDWTSNLIGENIASEREYKLEVLDWLNNGKPKVFRSPGEGNYIVRLVNVSMAPNDQLGRMLHTFTATAYEIVEYNYKNLNTLGLISVGDPTIEQLRWETVELNKVDLNNNLLNYKAVAIKFEGMIPGDKFFIKDNIKRTYIDDNGNEYNELGYEIIIGVTGSYIIDLDFGVEISEITFLGGPNYNNENIYGNNPLIRQQGTLTYAYYSRIQNIFDSIVDVEISDDILLQFIGEHDIINEIEDIKTSIQDFYFIHCMLRDIHKVYYFDNQYYRSDRCFDEDVVELDPYVLYHVFDKNGNEQYYLDGNNMQQYSLEEYSTKILIDNREIDISNPEKIPVDIAFIDLIDRREVVFQQPKDVKTFVISNGIMAEVSCQKQILEYSVEYEPEIDLYDNLKTLQNIYQEAYQALYNKIYLVDYVDELENIDPKTRIEEIAELNNAYNIAYNNYIERLEKALEEKEAAQGDVAI